MATQIKPLTSGSFTTVSQTGDKRAKKDAVGLPAAPGLQHACLRAINMWLDVAGAAGAVTLAAQKTAHAAGIILQEV
jgi:hypothetical protein